MKNDKDDRRKFFDAMLEQARKLVDEDGVMGMVIVVMPTSTHGDQPIAALGGMLSLGDLDRAFSDLIEDMEEQMGIPPEERVSAVRQPRNEKKTIH